MRMRKLLFRAEFGEVNPATPFGFVSAGTHSASTIVAAAAVFGTWDRIRSENIRYGDPPDPLALDELEKAKRALEEFDRQKLDDTARRLSEATSDFLKVDQEIRDCERRRTELFLHIERETSQNSLRYQLLTDERNKLLGKRKEARARANELSCCRTDDSPTDYPALVATLRDGGKFAEETLDTLLVVAGSE